jgi:hypothetical protein
VYGAGAFMVQDGTYTGRSVVFRNNQYTPGTNPPLQGANHILTLNNDPTIVFNTTVLTAGTAASGVPDVNGDGAGASDISFCNSNFTQGTAGQDVTLLATGGNLIRLCNTSPNWENLLAGNVDGNDCSVCATTSPPAQCRANIPAMYGGKTPWGLQALLDFIANKHSGMPAPGIQSARSETVAGPY